jgi:uncharacterized protein (TIGR01777 family)
MDVCITGASGLVGSALVAKLEDRGHRVRRFTRNREASGQAYWDPATGQIDRQALQGADVLVHLAGESIARGRWTAKKKDRILRSRVDGTRLISSAWADVGNQPRSLISASAIGYYGSRGDECLTEASSPGQGFLSQVCRQWEAETQVAAQAGVRVVNLRLGLVLSPEGGALAALLPIFRAGAGGRIGDGRQWMSWIDLEDLTEVILAAATDERLSGPVNAVAPNPVTNAEFARVLGRVLHRPTVLPTPKFAIRAAMGEMADELLLASQRVVPQRLEEIGFAFRSPDLETALRFMLAPAR